MTGPLCEAISILPLHAAGKPLTSVPVKQTALLHPHPTCPDNHPGLKTRGFWLNRARWEGPEPHPHKPPTHQWPSLLQGSKGNKSRENIEVTGEMAMLLCRDGEVGVSLGPSTYVCIQTLLWEQR